MFTHDRAHERVGTEECRRLLGSEHVGRVALSVGALPTVVPVLYRLVGDRVVFSVEPDDLYDVLSDNVVAFEVDHLDDETNEGWTVLVVGRARPALDLVVPAFALPGMDKGEARDRLIGIGIERLSGQKTVAPVGAGA
jgi:uncharacterized protein